MPALNAKCCANCTFLFIDQEATASAAKMNLKQPEFGQCRRYPPTPLLVPTNGGLSVMPSLPPVVMDGYCGEFRQRLLPLAIEPVNS